LSIALAIRLASMNKWVLFAATGEILRFVVAVIGAALLIFILGKLGVSR